ncbi:MAG: type II toxin-antitoxin system YafQ family toxin [Alphaproteobacteria bacterium]|nr:type II toxin-antitoxin system YafQ family toxin [Alphaproteobacteria bacterium]
MLAEERLEPRCRVHRLSGQRARSWKCHIAPDWPLIWHIEDDVLMLTRTGTHCDLFGRRYEPLEYRSISLLDPLKTRQVNALLR